MKKYGLQSLILLLPVIIFYCCHFAQDKNGEAIPTGFIQPDQPYYIANAREYSDRGDVSLAYPLPFSSDYHNDAIYFQPHILVLGILLPVTGLDPGVLFVGFGALFSFLCVFICLKLYNEVTHHDKSLIGKAGNVIFIWGGGVLFILGFVTCFLITGDVKYSINDAFIFDPSAGWWCLNPGRTFIYPMEAYYHFLFFSALYCILKKEYKTALAVAALLIFSHPFTGIAVAIILTSWSLLEVIIRKSKLPIYFPAVMVVLLLSGAYYYLIYLKSDHEHAVLMKQWTLDWSGKAINFIPAYFLVGILAVARLVSKAKFLSFVSMPFNRLLLVWLFVNLGLENHDLFITPHQPLHFSRGYVWAALFLIGYPAFIRFFNDQSKYLNVFAKRLLIAVMVFFFCLDNIMWFAKYSYWQYDGTGMRLNKDEVELFHFLEENQYKDHLLLSPDLELSYKATVYTKYRCFYSHNFNTIDPAGKRLMVSNFYEKCLVGKEMKGKPVIYIREEGGKNCFDEEARKIYGNKRYTVFQKQF
jgi:hypothetical protein